MKSIACLATGNFLDFNQQAIDPIAVWRILTVQRFLQVLLVISCLFVAEPTFAKDREYTVEAVDLDPNAPFVTVSYQKGRRVATEEFDIGDGAEIIVDGENSALDALRIGQKVAMELDDDDFVAKIVTLDEPQAAPESDESVSRQKIDELVKRFGAGHWRVTDAKLKQSYLKRLQSFDQAQRELLVQAEQFQKSAQRLLDSNQYAEAYGPALKALEIRKKILGETDIEYAHSLNTLGRVFLGATSQSYDLERYLKAEEFFLIAYEIREKQLGKTHPDFRRTLDLLSEVYLAITQKDVDLKDAEITWKQMIAVRKMQHGESHWQVTDARLGLQRVQLLMKLSDEQREQLDEAEQLTLKMNQFYSEEKLAEARQSAEEIVKIRRKVWGENRMEVADSLNTLAVLLDLTCETKEAVSNYQQALDIYRKVLGKQHPVYEEHRTFAVRYFESLGSYDRARSLYEEALAVDSERYGSDDRRTQVAHADVQRIGTLLKADAQERKELGEAAKLTQLAYQLNKEDRFTNALEAAEEARKIRAEILGANHIDVAECLNLLGVVHFRSGNLKEAEQHYLKAKDIRKSMGSSHPLYASSINNLADVYRAFGEYEKALPLYEEALEISRLWSAERPVDLAASLNNLALLLQDLGAYEKAKPLYDEALKIMDDNKHKWLAADYAAEYAQSLNNLAGLFQIMGDTASARPLGRRAMEIRRQYLGEETLDYANSLNNQATLYYEQARRRLKFDVKGYDKAEEYFDKARQILGKQNVEHPDYATTLTNLAILFDDRAKFDDVAERREEYGLKAGKLLQDSLETRLKISPENHPDVAASRGALAGHYRSVGRFQEAEDLYKQALEDLKIRLGEEHPDRAVMLRNLAKLYDSQGKYEAAVPHLNKSLKIARRKLEQAASVQSERQQLAMASMFRGTLDRWLSLSTRTEMSTDETYEHVLRWKGVVFARQFEQRKYRQIVAESDDPAVTGMIHDLESTACRLASLALSRPLIGKEQAHFQRLGELTRRKAELEAELSSNAAFSEMRDVAQVTPDQLRELLPPEVVLVDLLEYNHVSPSVDGTGRWNTERRLMAFLVRKQQPIAALELGRIEPIVEAVNLWLAYTKRKNPIIDGNVSRHTMVNLAFQDGQWFLIPQQRGEDDLAQPRIAISQQEVETILDRVTTVADREATSLKIDPALVLQRLFWNPLDEHLLPKEYVLVSPDGAIARMPLAALPGREENTYLIEERAIATIAVPQLLPELLSSERQKEKPEPKMLLVGDVEYGAQLIEEQVDSLPREQREGIFEDWAPLGGTRTEILAIADSFKAEFNREPQSLKKQEATEKKVREQAPNHSWLHFATHGFFAQPEKHSALGAGNAKTRSTGMTREAETLASTGVGGFHPGVLSGVVLAGANNLSGDGSNDGILTAMEVAEMDLRETEVVILSACETGLGEVAGGEGVLGIQRAFQMAGAKTVMASFWTVDDVATQQLMSHFYEQLWQRKESQLGKLEAFREAQLIVLRNGLERSARPIEDKEPESKLAPRTPPFEWASFSISGDWR